MLTVQPKITQYSQQRNQISFKNSELAGIPDDSFYRDRQNYYENQIREFDELIEDEHTPSAFKKVLKGFRVVSEGLLEGCAVAWGASKGAKVIKSAAVKGASSNFTKKAAEFIKPMAEGFRTTGAKIWTAISDKASAIKGSKFVTNLSEKFGKFVEKMRNNKVGKYIVKGFEYVGKAIKWVGSKIAQGFKYITGKAKAVNGSEAYDKAASITSKTLGAGAGVAGAYNAATRADERAEVTASKVNNDAIDFSELDEVEQYIEEGE
jgi:hypothetical protein